MSDYKNGWGDWRNARSERASKIEQMRLHKSLHIYLQNTHGKIYGASYLPVKSDEGMTWAHKLTLVLVFLVSFIITIKVLEKV